MLRRIGSTLPVVHCYREQNHVAAALARNEATIRSFGGIKRLAVPPVYALSHVRADILGTSYVRKIKHCPTNAERNSFIFEPDLQPGLCNMLSV